MTNLNSIFTPQIAIRNNSKYFVGRENDLKKLFDHVGIPGNNVIIYGERGVGKTSLGFQLKRRLEEINIKTKWFEATSFIKNLDGVLYSILDELDILIKKGLSTSSLMKVFQKEVQKKYELNSDNEVIIFIDEFDRIPDKSGFASLIKTIRIARFVIIGVADNYKELIQDHNSIERKLSYLNLSTLDVNAIKEFHNLVESDLGKKIKFCNDYQKKMWEYSNGFPYILQSISYRVTKQSLAQIQDFNLNEFPLEIKEREFLSAFNNLFFVEGNSTRQKVFNKAFEYNKNKRISILKKIMIAINDTLSVNDLIKKLKPEDSVGLVENLNVMEDLGILKNLDTGYKFSDPIYRGIFKYNSEAISTS